MLIREMQIDDIPELAKLYKQFWDEDSSVEMMQQQFAKLYNNGSYVFLSAVENGCLIGSVMGIICEELYGECKPFMVLENMIVDHSHRTKGVGRALISSLEMIAREHLCSQIILVTETNRLDACKFYESVGFNPLRNKGFKKKL